MKATAFYQRDVAAAVGDVVHYDAAAATVADAAGDVAS